MKANDHAGVRVVWRGGSAGICTSFSNTSAVISAAIALASPASAQALAPLQAELVKKWPRNRTVNVVFHGHSVPSGYHKMPDVRPFESYPHLVQVALKEKFPHAVLT